MNEPEVVTESVMAPPVEAHANGSNGPVELAPAADAVSSTPPLPEMAPPVPDGGDRAGRTNRPRPRIRWRNACAAWKRR